jgi:hypothetical protein
LTPTGHYGTLLPAALSMMRPLQESNDRNK